MKTLFSSIAMIFACFALSAQCAPGGGGTPSVSGTTVGVSNFNSSLNTSYYQSALNESLRNANGVRIAYQNMEGSPYLNNEATPGTLVINGGRTIENIPLQIDLFNQEIIATVMDEKVVLDGRFFEEIIVTLDGKELNYKKINPKRPNKFYEVLYEDGDMVFFKERYVSLREGSNNGIVKKLPRFNTRPKYYIKHGEGDVAKVKLKKKDIFSGFLNAEVYAMKEYAKRNGIKFKSESDFVAVFEGANSLVQN